MENKFRFAEEVQTHAVDPALDRFNRRDESALREAVRACLDVDSWVDEVVAPRPYADRDALLDTARQAAHPFTRAEVEGALAHHPRIGERAAGDRAEAAMSRSEQQGVDPADLEVARRLEAGNAAYEERFGHVFLIRAAGRSAAQILDQLQARLTRSPEQEWETTAAELREIAVLRLEGVLES